MTASQSRAAARCELLVRLQQAHQCWYLDAVFFFRSFFLQARTVRAVLRSPRVRLERMVPVRILARKRLVRRVQSVSLAALNGFRSLGKMCERCRIVD